ncbi:MAG: transcription termination/antitermination protein NusG [Bacteroidales bacterium]|jgi:transcriptional antiterminator NusG|nr:transcription termination/antitermination protein NusG [Bacteroidales bacterium]
MNEQTKKWYVVRAIAGKERKAKEYIDNEIARLNIRDIVSQVLIPTERVYSVRNGKRIGKDKTLFPGYILIEATLEGEIIHTIKNIPNVIGFLSERNGTPLPLQDNEINRILGKMDDMITADVEIENPFIVGETVKVVDGPFNNFSGIIEDINVEKRKLKVVVKIFGRKTPVELSFFQVEK